QLDVVVDLPVVDEREHAVTRPHRLIRGRRQIDDRKTTVAQGDVPSWASAYPRPRAVGAAVVQAVAHGVEICRVDRLSGDDHDEAAHQSILPCPLAIQLRAVRRILPGTRSRTGLGTSARSARYARPRQ